MFLSYYQIYLDNIQDLLNPLNSNIQVRETEGEVFLEDLYSVEVSNPDQAFNLLNAGSNFREIA